MNFENIKYFNNIILHRLSIINHGFVLDDDLVCKKNDFVQEGIGGIKDMAWTFALCPAAKKSIFIDDNPNAIPPIIANHGFTLKHKSKI